MDASHNNLDSYASFRPRGEWPFVSDFNNDSHTHQLDACTSVYGEQENFDAQANNLPVRRKSSK